MPGLRTRDLGGLHASAITGLSSRAAVFTNAHAEMPASTQARTAMMTGRGPHSTGAIRKRDCFKVVGLFGLTVLNLERLNDFVATVHIIIKHTIFKIRHSLLEFFNT